MLRRVGVVLPGNEGMNKNKKTSVKRMAMWPFNVLVLLLLGAVCYWQIAAFRKTVDAKVPWIADRTARFFPPETAPGMSETPTPAPIVAVAVPEPAAAPSVAPEPVAVVPATPEPMPVPSVEVDLQQLSTTPSDWPKAVAVKKEMVFPAVVAGKSVGNVRVPPGTLTHLVAIQNGLLGLEYQGGGGWHKPEETDLIERVRAARQPSSR